MEVDVICHFTIVCKIHLKSTSVCLMNGHVVFLFSFDSYMYVLKNHTTLKQKRYLPYFTDRRIKTPPWNTTLFEI